MFEGGKSKSLKLKSRKALEHCKQSNSGKSVGLSHSPMCISVIRNADGEFCAWEFSEVNKDSTGSCAKCL